MKGKRAFGWFVIIIGAIGLIVSVLHDYQIDIGPFEMLYEMFDWISFGAFISLLVESFASVIGFITRYFWTLIFICFGMAIVFGAKRQEQYDYDLTFDYDSEERKRRLSHALCRNVDDMKLAGVCSGIARKFDIDPTIIRIIVLFMAFMSGGSVVFIYLLLAFLLPKEHLGG